MKFPKETVDAYLLSNNELIQKERLEGTIDWLRHASIVGVDDKEYIRRRWRILQGSGKVGDNKLSYRNDSVSSPDVIEEKVTTNETQGVHEIKYEGGQIITKQQFFQHINFDEANSEILSYQTNVRQVVLRTGPNETTLVNKYEHFLRTRPYKGIDVNKILYEVDKRIGSIKFNHSNYLKENTKNDKLLEICLFDAHINKKSYNSQDWNSSIAREVYLEMIGRMVRKAKKIDSYSHCLLIVGNDFFNSDANSRTTSGTPQDNTESEETAFAIGLEILINAIDMLQRELKCVIEVMSIPGNHAKLLEQVLGTSLKAIYRNNNNVFVDDTQGYRKYFEYGNTGIMFSHGDGCKKDRLPMLFANERSDIWSRVKYRECHLAHIHTRTRDEINGVTIEHLSSITTTDERHSKSGYVGNRRGGQMFIYDKESGRDGEFSFYI